MTSTKVAIASWTIGFCIAAAAVFLKLYTRIRYVNGLEVDDYIAICTLIILGAGMGMIYTMLLLGLQQGEAYWASLPTDKLELLFKCYFISVQLYTYGILFCKLSIIFLYKRITKTSMILPRLNTLLTTLVWICIIFTLIGSLLNFFWCKPLYAFWTAMPFPMMEKYCSMELVEASVYMYSGYNIVTDVCIMIVPYFLFAQARIRSRGQRVALFILFGIGIFVVVSTIIKIVAIAQPKKFQPPELVLWSFVEACVAVFVVCLPSLPPLIWKNSSLINLRWDGEEFFPDEVPQVKLGPLPNTRLFEVFSNIGLERRQTNKSRLSRLRNHSFATSSISKMSNLALSEHS
ncbi:hypothetical protein H072_10034 [Dactylellina haptotyla CBS 200.50]|uniref:Rhodopsin domain-containing protein n=1 Tax=Dactylellina haptotyla (strain CBS 200.50) TaxID=1284197 RepID=S8A5Q8_DACHA|nr:hypothetical protein H072_10034 [Dactylellina haptotyla CBS 200.50]